MPQDKVVRLDPAVDGVEAVTEQRAKYVQTMADAVKKMDTKGGKCEVILWEGEGSDGGERRGCAKKAKFWVQRGPINQLVCGTHLPATITRFWQIQPGRYGMSVHYDGYWIRATSSVVVKMRTEGGGWR